MKRGAFGVLVLGILFLFSSQAMAQEAGSGFKIERMVIATGIENREPIGVAEAFPSSTQKVYCFVEARNIQEDSTVTIVWSLNGKEVHRYAISLKKGFRWRTYSEKTIHGMTGDWKVDLLDSSGNILRTATFRVE